MITVRYARQAPRDNPKDPRSKTRAGTQPGAADPSNAQDAGQTLTYAQPGGPVIPGGSAGSAPSAGSALAEAAWADASSADDSAAPRVVRPMLEAAQWKALDAYAPAAVDALLAVAARNGDSVMLEAARASGLVGESLEDSETGTAVPRRIRAVWRLLCANPQHRAIADDWLARALVESPGAVVRLLLDVSAPDWTTLAAAVLAAGVDPWMPLPGDETRVGWGELAGVALESPSIVALALARGPEVLDRPDGPSALRALAPRARAGVPMVGLLHDPRRRDQHGRAVDFFEAFLACYESRPIPESEVAFAFTLANPAAPPEQDDLLADAAATSVARDAAGANPSARGVPAGPRVIPPYGSIDVSAGQHSKVQVPIESGLAAALRAGMDPVAARIAVRAGALLGSLVRDPAELAGVPPVPALDRPETIDSLKRQRWLLITRLAVLAGPAARPDPELDRHDRSRLIPWPLASVLAAGAPARSTRAESQADDRRAAAALRAIVGSGFEVDAIDSMGRSALLLACRRPDRAETVRTLLDLGANPNHVDGRGQDASTYARHGGNVQVIAAVRNAQARTVLERLRGPEFE
ncbi:MAG: ankyrin repeat domain-containing protein [Betaproteobacteria bacterium]|nr:ankyrin repeat domain-containing protein [Betaproteobacteria bacterium]